MEAALREICRIIRDEDDFLVASHYNPDGDALGSTAAMGHLLKALGKKFELYNASPVPRQYDWLPLPKPLRRDVPVGFDGWYIVVDCGDLARTGDDLPLRIDPRKTINMDHHLGNPGFGAVNWIDVTKAATGEMVAVLADHFGVPLSGGLGETVYTAVATDTGYFSYGSTTPGIHELAAEILRQGLDPEDVNAKIKNQWSVERIRLWSETLGGLELFYGGAVGVITVTRAMLKRTRTHKEDCDGLINFVRQVRGVRVSVILREDGPLQTKLSLRSMRGDSVQPIAASFGGGGHKNAAGCTIFADPEEAKRLVVEAIGEQFGLKD